MRCFQTLLHFCKTHMTDWEFDSINWDMHTIKMVRDAKSRKLRPTGTNCDG
jgi:hypothetical protein